MIAKKVAKKLVGGEVAKGIYQEAYNQWITSGSKVTFVDWLLTNPEGQTYAPSVVRSLIGEAGFSNPTATEKSRSDSGGSVRVPNHQSGGVTSCPRGGPDLQVWQRQQWGDY